MKTGAIMFKAKISEFNHTNQQQKRMKTMDEKMKDRTDRWAEIDKRFLETELECLGLEEGATANEIKIKKLESEIKYLKDSTPQETLEETITERLGDNWVDYMDSKGLKRDPDGLCPAELETAFIGLVEGLRKFFKENKIDAGFTHHSSKSRELTVDPTPNDLEMGVGVLSISPLQWELMIAITQYIEGHVIDSEEIVYLAEER